jgi:hypothetical protein
VRLFIGGEEIHWVEPMMENWWLENNELDEAYKLYSKEMTICE